MEDSHAVGRFRIDPERSTVTVAARPRLTDGPGAAVRSVDGTVELDGHRVVEGRLVVTLDGDPTPSAAIDLDHRSGEVSTGPDGDLVLHGRADRPAGSFGLSGPPLLNPTLQLRWRLVLRPA